MTPKKQHTSFTFRGGASGTCSSCGHEIQLSPYTAFVQITEESNFPVGYVGFYCSVDCLWSKFAHRIEQVEEQSRKALRMAEELGDLMLRQSGG